MIITLCNIVLRNAVLHKYIKMQKSDTSNNLNLPFNVTSDIAKGLNKNHKTVSQILNGKLNDYSKETILNVYKEAKELMKKKGRAAKEGLERIDAAIEKMMAA